MAERTSHNINNKPSSLEFLPGEKNENKNTQIPKDEKNKMMEKIVEEKKQQKRSRKTTTTRRRGKREREKKLNWKIQARLSTPLYPFIFSLYTHT